MKTLLELDSVALGYGQSIVLASVSFRVRSGEVVGIIGDNGCGKSTLARSIAGSISVAAGRVIWDGSDVTRLSAVFRRKLGLMYCPQDAQVFPSLSIRENILLGNQSWAVSGEGWNGVVSTELMPDFLERLDAKAGELSGGQQQLVAITRALAGNPRLLVFDEPLSSLSEGAAHSILNQLRRLSRSGLAVVLIEHRSAISAVCDRVLTLSPAGLVPR